jgi:2-polyprenyl-3-methyl-5-hydroxy-6-metoxy-1,4-benzoquinol methylase
MTENVNCPICETDKSHFFYGKERNDRTANYVICGSCGLVYQSPRMTSMEFNEYYKASFRTETSATVGDLDQYILRRTAAGRRIKKFVSKHQKENFLQRFGLFRKSVLDVGCGSGAVLLPFKERRYICRGLDIPSSMTEYGRTQLDLDIAELPFDEFQTEDQFDLIILSHVVEHILNPIDFLAKVRTLLKDDGGVYVEVPDVERPYGKDPKFFFLLGHVYYYSLTTLENIFNKCGFELVEHDRKSSKFLKTYFRKREQRNFRVKAKHSKKLRAQFEKRR